jgi:hypothetical protein
MGDGPAYDYAYAQADRRRREKREAQSRRRDMLLEIMRSIGFGESDGDLTMLEKEAATNLQRAYELLSLMTRQGGGR